MDLSQHDHVRHKSRPLRPHQIAFSSNVPMSLHSHPGESQHCACSVEDANVATVNKTSAALSYAAMLILGVPVPSKAAVVAAALWPLTSLVVTSNAGSEDRLI